MSGAFSITPFGLRFIWTDAAMETTKERLFPESRHRSKRIHKKLVKRFGGEFRRVPAMWRHGNTIYAHPSLRAKVEATLRGGRAP